MRPRSPRRALLVPWLAVVLVACAASEPESASRSEPASDVTLQRCTEPRRPICTKEYRPVCGHRCAEPPCAAAERHTYGNACDACAHAEVVAFAPGPCDSEAQETTPAR